MMFVPLVNSRLSEGGRRLCDRPSARLVGKAGPSLVGGVWRRPSRVVPGGTGTAAAIKRPAVMKRRRDGRRLAMRGRCC